MENIPLYLFACSKSKSYYFMVKRNYPNTTEKNIRGFPDKSEFRSLASGVIINFSGSFVFVS